MHPQQRLSQIIKSGNIPHAFLFAGPQGAGKKEVTEQFALELVGDKKKKRYHPDIHHYTTEGKSGMHPISSIRALINDASLAPFESKWKVYIIYDAERMLPTSSNALLKTLEEPTDHTVIILVSNHQEQILPTILSRCQIIDFPPSSKRKPNELLLDLLGGVVPLEKVKKIEEENVDDLFETILFWYRDRLLLEIDATYLHFPNRLSQLKKSPLISLEEVEKIVIQARLAYDRSTKLSTCLEMVLLQVENSA